MNLVSINIVNSIILILYLFPVILIPFVFYLVLKKYVGLFRFILISVALFTVNSFLSIGIYMVDNYFCQSSEYYEGCVFGVKTWDVFMPVILLPMIFYSIYLGLYLILFVYLTKK